MTTPMRSPVTIAELTAGLIWPRLLRAFPLSMAPSRLGIGFIAAAGTAAIGSLFDSIRGRPLAVGTIETVGVFESLADTIISTVSGVALGLVTFDAMAIGAAATNAVERIGAVLAGAPLSAAILAVVLLPLYVICGVALCRSVACDTAWRVAIGPGAALRFGLRRARSGVGAMLIPGVIIGFMAVLLMALGWLAQWPVLDVIAGALYAMFLLLGLVIVIIGVGAVAAHALVLPAIAADNADAIDAAQRAYAYIIGRPGRLIGYIAIALAIGAVALVVLSLIVAWTMNVTAQLSGAWVDGGALGGAIEPFTWTRTSPVTGTASVAHWMVRFWEGLLALLLVGWAISYHFTSGTILYLLLRRVNDDQDVEEIWLGPDAQRDAASA